MLPVCLVNNVRYSLEYPEYFGEGPEEVSRALVVIIQLTSYLSGCNMVCFYSRTTKLFRSTVTQSYR